GRLSVRRRRRPCAVRNCSYASFGCCPAGMHARSGTPRGHAWPGGVEGLGWHRAESACGSRGFPDRERVHRVAKSQRRASLEPGKRTGPVTSAVPSLSENRRSGPAGYRHRAVRRSPRAPCLQAASNSMKRRLRRPRSGAMYPVVVQHRRRCLGWQQGRMMKAAGQYQESGETPEVRAKSRYAASIRLCVAPMMDWTDSHCRVFHRLLAPHARLYSEMVHANAVIHGDRAKLLGMDPVEHPVALQLGGSEPALLAQAARIGAEHGFDEVNLNCGCPSDRVQAGRFGACLMREPALVADGVAAMIAACDVPVTVKCRLGVDD